jgi:hypothetical protein
MPVEPPSVFPDCRRAAKVSSLPMAGPKGKHKETGMPYFINIGSFWELGELRQIIGDGEPRSFARNINIHLWADAWIIIQRAQRQAK